MVACKRRRIGVDVQFESDGKHIEEHAQLGDDTEEGRDVGREYERGKFRSEE